MAGNVKGITIEFDGNTTKLDKALKDVKGSTKDIDRELNDVNKALKFNPTSVDLWRQKQDLLRQKITQTEKNLQNLRNAQQQLDNKHVDKNSEEYRKLQRAIIETESKLKTFKGQLQAIGSVKLQAVGAQMKSIGGKITAAGQSLRTASRYATAFTAAIGAMTYKAGKWADDINTMSKVYHISTEQLQLYGAAAKLVDVDVETIAKSHTKLAKNMSNAAQGSEKQVEAFKQLGINIKNSDGSLRSADDVFNDVVSSLGKMENETERDALAMTLMGKSATELNPLIEDGGETYKKVSETMKKYGLDFIDQKTLDDANKFNDAVDTIKAVGTVALQQLGTAMAGYLAPAMEQVVGFFGQIANWLSNLDPQILTIVTLISAGLAVLSPLLIVIGTLVSSIGSIVAGLGSLSGAFAVITGPIGMIVAAVAALVAAFVFAYNKSTQFRLAVDQIFNVIKAAFIPVIDSAKAMLKTLWDTLIDVGMTIATQLAPVLKMLMPVIKALATFMAGRLKTSFNMIAAVVKVVGAVIKSLATIVSTVVTTVGSKIASLKSKFESVANAFKKMFGGGVKAPHVPLPHFSISPAGWKIGDLLKGKIPSLSVKWYAQGGIFNGPTLAGIGEAGPEAVVPLDKFWDRLSELQGGIVINVYGADGQSVNDLAEAVKQKLIETEKRRRLAWQ